MTEPNFVRTSNFYQSLFEIVNHYFRNLHHQLPIHLDYLKEIHDPSQRISSVISTLKFGGISSTIIARNLKFLYDHKTILEMGIGVTYDVFADALIKIYDLRLAFFNAGFPYEIVQLTFDFMIQYDKLFTDQKVFLKVGNEVRMLLCPRYSPPKYKTMRWYQNQELNHTWFFWNRKIRFLKGEKAYEECIIRRVIGEEIKVEYDDGTLGNVGLDVPLAWGSPD